MSATAIPTSEVRPPLTQLSDEEQMFQASVREFSRKEIAPLVREMDEAGVIRKDLYAKLFELGLMSIDIPEAYGGQGGSFFQSILAIEEVAAVDPSIAVVVDVQNTLFNNAIQRWGTEAQKRHYLPKIAKNLPGSYCLSEAGSGSDAFASSSRHSSSRSDNSASAAGTCLASTQTATSGESSGHIQQRK